MTKRLSEEIKRFLFDAIKESGVVEISGDLCLDDNLDKMLSDSAI